MEFRIDLHVHTKRYSGCAEFLEPTSIAKYAVVVGLDAVVLTEHDWLWERLEIEELARRSTGIRFFRGMECSARGCHILLIGLQEAAPFHRGISPEKAIELAHGQGAVAILAHPFRDSDPWRLPVKSFDAIEVNSTSFHGDDSDRAQALADAFHLPQVAAGDAHALSRIGWACTVFERRPRNEEELAAMIRAGRCRAVADHR